MPHQIPNPKSQIPNPKPKPKPKTQGGAEGVPAQVQHLGWISLGFGIWNLAFLECSNLEHSATFLSRTNIDKGGTAHCCDVRARPPHKDKNRQDPQTPVIRGPFRKTPSGMPGAFEPGHDTDLQEETSRRRSGNRGLQLRRLVDIHAGSRHRSDRVVWSDLRRTRRSGRYRAPGICALVPRWDRADLGTLRFRFTASAGRPIRTDLNLNGYQFEDGVHSFGPCSPVAPGGANQRISAELSRSRFSKP